MREPGQMVALSSPAFAMEVISSSETEEIREWLYTQAVAVGLGDRERTSIDQIYYGGEDGRFVGYFSDTVYTERGSGAGMASDLLWAPFNLSSVNAICNDTGPPCRREQGKVLGLPPGGCPAGDRATSCTSAAP